MKFNTEDTIVALATAHGSAAIAVIRLSGPQAIQIVDQFFFTKTLKKKSLVQRASR
jgi:tRNA modification GTPase